MISNLLSFYMKHKGNAFLKLDKWDNKDKIVHSNGALYIHIPFCSEICDYCSFTKFIYKKEIADVYFKSLKKEIKMYKHKGFNFTEVYFGGGTPSIDMQKLLEIIYLTKSLFSIKNISVELKIDDLVEKNITLLKSAGVNRISVGVQSFNDDSNCSIGRKNKKINIKDALNLANNNFKTLNVDLIFNLPNQKEKDLIDDLKHICDFGITQVTVYPLMPNYNNAFSKIDNSKEKKFYDLIVKFMEKQDYKQSSVWCFVKNKSGIDEYFISNDEYIGVGCGAISFSDKEVRVNSFLLDKYSNLLEHDKLPIILHKKLDDNQFLDYYLLTKAFGLSIDKKRFKKLFGKDIDKINYFKFAKLFGYVKFHTDSLIISKKGKYYISVLMRDFFSSLNRLRNSKKD